MDLPDGTPKQLTNYEDSVSFVRWLGNGGAKTRRLGEGPGRIGRMAQNRGRCRPRTYCPGAITLYTDLWAAAVDTVGIANWESFLKNTSGYRRRQREVELRDARQGRRFLTFDIAAQKDDAPFRKFAVGRFPVFDVLRK